MKRYIFLLLAFFLSFNAHAFSMGGVSAAPNAVATTNTAPVTTGASSRSAEELGNLKESTQQAQQPALNTNSQLNNVNAAGVPNTAAKTKTTAVSTVSCKTYEGKIYDQGEAGYNDCIRTIKNDRQGTKTVP